MNEWVIPFLTICLNGFIAWLSQRSTRQQIDRSRLENKSLKQDLADKAIESNNKLFDRRQKERDDNERIREEEKKEYEDALKRISKDLIDFQTNLRNKESREVILLNDIERYKKMKIEDDVRFGEMEQKLAVMENKQEKHDVAIEKIVRKTAPLPEREELKK